MTTAVLDLDLQTLPSEILGLERFNQAFILVRFAGQPVGVTTLEISNGRLGGSSFRTSLIEASGQPLFAHWVRTTLEFDESATVNPVDKKATVAICTRERADDLQRALRALTELPDDGQDILVIDNCPATDKTFNVVKQFPDVRYVREDRKGLDVARNRALREATHDIVAFIDDDAVPDRGWLRGLVRNFGDPRVYAVTGLTMPLELETPAQEWFERYGGFSRGFRRCVFDQHWHHPMAVGAVGAGVNMAIRRQLLEDVGPFDEALDAGTRTQSGGDHEIFSRILASGYRVVYDPAALNWHRHRRTWPELRQTIYGYGVGAYAAWTRSVLEEHELGVAKIAWWWLKQDQAPAVARIIWGKPSKKPADLVFAELRGCLAGPAAYVRARRDRRKEAQR